MSKQHRKTRRREKRARKHGTSAAVISRKPPTIVVPAPLPVLRTVIDTDLRWCAVQTYPQHENRVAARLKGMGRTVYAPTMVQQRIRRNRPYTLTRYMLPRHIFVGIAKGEHPRDLIGAVQGVFDFFKFCGSIVMFTAADIQRFANTMQDEAEAAIRPKAGPRNGERMMVIDGPFASFTATVSGPAADGMIQADVNIFGRLSPVDFHPEQLAAVDRYEAAA